jgi:periplasmic divalent cation tolerance protein
MKTDARACLVLVTAPNLECARRLAQTVLNARLVACVNVVPGLESHYWWQGKLEAGSEVLLLLKTHRSQLRALERLVLANHPYETPEFLVVPVAAGNARYLEWIGSSLARPQRRQRPQRSSAT